MTERVRLWQKNLRFDIFSRKFRLSKVKVVVIKVVPEPPAVLVASEPILLGTTTTDNSGQAPGRGQEVHIRLKLQTSAKNSAAK